MSTRMAASASTVAALVRDVEIGERIEPAPAASPDGRRYARVALLARVFGEPVGIVVVPMPAGGLDAEAIARSVMSHHGPAIRDKLAGVADADLSTLPVDGVPAVATPPAVERRARALLNGPDITVVVCTRNRPASLARTLESLRHQEYRRHRVLVVDNASADTATEEIAHAAGRHAPVDYLLAPTPGLSHARNAAMAARPGSILAWLDDDATADRYWLTELAVAITEHPDASVICGAVVPGELDTEAQLLFEEFGGLVKGRGFVPATFRHAPRPAQSPLYPLPPFGAGANMVTLPDAFTRIGGFDPALGAGTPARSAEDTLAFTELLLAGGVIVYHPSALVRHYHRRELADLREQLYGYGLGVTAFYTALMRRHPAAVFGLLRLAPAALYDLFAARGRREANLSAGFPRDLIAVGRRGMLHGPGAYLRGRRTSREDGVARP